TAASQPRSIFAAPNSRRLWHSAGGRSNIANDLHVRHRGKNREKAMLFRSHAIAVASFVALTFALALPGRAAGNLAGQTPI
ncbi:hypothetical protein, partial [Paenibacillus sp. SER-28]